MATLPINPPFPPARIPDSIEMERTLQEINNIMDYGWPDDAALLLKGYRQLEAENVRLRQVDSLLRLQLETAYTKLRHVSWFASTCAFIAVFLTGFYFFNGFRV